MNIQFSYRNGWQFVCWIGGPPAARTWLKNSGLSIACVSSRRFSSFQAGSVLWNSAGTLPGTESRGYHPNPKPSPFTVSAPSGELSDCFTRECCASRIKVDGWRGSPEYASQRHMTSSPCSLPGAAQLDPPRHMLAAVERHNREPRAHAAQFWGHRMPQERA